MKAMLIDPIEAIEAAASGPEATYAATPALHHEATSRQSTVTGACRSGPTDGDPGTPASRASSASLGKRGRQKEQPQRRAEK
jgi:hypothetical protein